MPQVLVRNVDRKTLDLLKARARRNGRSLQAEVKLILEDAAGKDPGDFWKMAARIRKALAGRPQTDSVTLLHEDRSR